MIKNEGWQNTLSALKIYVGGNKEDRLRLHYLDKAKHFIRSIVGIVIFIFGNIAIGLKILAPKLVDLKTVCGLSDCRGATVAVKLVTQAILTLS